MFIKDGIGSDETVTECESFRCSDNGEVPTIPVNVNCSDKTDGFFCAFCKPLFFNCIEKNYILKLAAFIHFILEYRYWRTSLIEK